MLVKVGNDRVAIEQIARISTEPTATGGTFYTVHLTDGNSVQYHDTECAELLRVLDLIAEIDAIGLAQAEQQIRAAKSAIAKPGLIATPGMILNKKRGA